ILLELDAKRKEIHKEQETRHKKKILWNEPECESFVLCPLPRALYLVPCTFYVIFAAMKILMVCLGNICRSPLAEGVLQDKALKAGLNWSIESAGTDTYHVGEAPHPLSQKVAIENGIDICNQRA